MFPAEMYFETNDFKTDIDFRSQFVNFHILKAHDNILKVMNSFENIPTYYLADNEDDSITFTMPTFNIEGQLNSFDSEQASLFLKYQNFMS